MTDDLKARLRACAKEFRLHNVYSRDGDTIRLRTQARECEDAADRIEALEAENKRLREDKLRLDFLDLCNARLNARYGTKYQWRLILNHNVSRLMLGSQEVDLDDSIANGLPSCRLAIDEQISAATRAALAGGGDE
ncbi:hypothetical protein GCM10007897_45120 [Sphingobium jiangsuense]|uniref:Uncharacterized protein n=1 Tax=Sphingobium jiangsuense TaxID=870476 RepID=A0A7W6BKM0_9SPHN|nr:hypothetical protein [Sphingobium jiangsuense]MBB3927649.1 hypothetical protein [Sphingobium jiangsuense]GLT03069.1 hypothetical protein GCM10007897_45120 [Sphingobium jiangsuense]